jgi:hypothetical protein
MPTTKATAEARNEPRTRTDLVLEAIALRHQIAVLKLSGTRRPCFRLWDRLFWIFLSLCPNWHESLLIVQPATVQRWRRNGSLEIPVTRSLARRAPEGISGSTLLDHPDGPR